VAAATDLPVVLLSHRGPARFQRTSSGLTINRAAGGLVTALMGLAEHLDDAVWVCAAATQADADVATEHEGHSVEIAFDPQPQLVVDSGDDTSGPTINVRYVDVDPDRHEAFYTQIANPLLWFVQHGLYGLASDPTITAETHRAFEEGYVAVNYQFAEAVADEVEARGGQALVLLQDYHFYLVAQEVRKRCPQAVISHFVHIPWPSPGEWQVLPAEIREPLLHGLLGSDVVAFHTRRFARNFLFCARELLDLPVDMEAGTIQVGDRTVWARYYPISIDVEAVEKLAASDEVAAHRTQIEDLHLHDGNQLIVRIDRTDPSKNILRGFKAFDLVLEEHPELKGKVTFLASLMPSRTDVPEYADYLAAVGGIVAEVNARHSLGGWQPIDLRLQEDLAFAVAAYELADVLVVNSVNDGMNLVAKEAVIANTRDGVLLLSETAGVHEELGAYAVTVNPFDIQQQADAMVQALRMNPELRHALMSQAAAVVRQNDVERWLDRQMLDLGKVLSSR
jgi:trehalose 6-phosphate synthase